MPEAPGASVSSPGVGDEVLADQPVMRLCTAPATLGGDRVAEEFLDLESWDPLAGHSQTPSGDTEKMTS